MRQPETYVVAASRKFMPLRHLAEREGFEPSVQFDPYTAFPVPHLRPLGHLSKLSEIYTIIGLESIPSCPFFVESPVAKKVDKNPVSNLG